MEKYSYLLLFLLLTNAPKAQSVFEFANQIKHIEFINPGYNTSKQKQTVKLIYANNYKNPNATKGLFVSNIYLPFNRFNTGLGATVMAESATTNSRTHYLLTACSKVNIRPNASLSLGIDIGLANTTTDVTHNTTYIKTDTSNFFYSSPGIYYTGKQLELGAALRYSPINTENLLEKNNFTYLLNACYTINLVNNAYLKPKIIYCYHTDTDYLETACFLEIRKIYEVGCSYRTNKTTMIFGDITLFKFLTLGYSFYHRFTENSYLSDGTHEFSLAVILP